MTTVNFIKVFGHKVCGQPIVMACEPTSVRLLPNGSLIDGKTLNIISNDTTTNYDYQKSFKCAYCGRHTNDDICPGCGAPQ